MKNPIIFVLLLITGSLFSQQTKSADSAKKSVSYLLDTVTIKIDSGFYLIEQVKEYTPGSALPKVTNNPYYFKDTTDFKTKINDLKSSSKFKLDEAQKKLEEARQLNLEGELRLKQAEILVGLLEVFKTPAPQDTKPELTPYPTIKKPKTKKNKKE